MNDELPLPPEHVNLWAAAGRRHQQIALRRLETLHAWRAWLMRWWTWITEACGLTVPKPGAKDVQAECRVQSRKRARKDPPMHHAPRTTHRPRRVPPGAEPWQQPTQTDATAAFVRSRRAAGQKLSRATLYAWDRAERGDGVLGLLPRARTGRPVTMPAWAREMFDRLYLDLRKRPISVCYAMVEAEAERRDERIPGVGAFRTHARRIPEPVRIRQREGEKAYRAQCEPSILRDYATYQANDEWHADHTVLNAWAKGPSGRLGRPWKTEWMDLRSRRVMGAIIYEGPPNTEAVLVSFARGAARYGLPRALRMDNGREFAAPTFAGPSRRWTLKLDQPRIAATLALLQVEVGFTIPERPQGKGALESKFRTDELWFDRNLPTYCGNSPKARPEDLAERLQDPDGIPTVAELDRLYDEYLAKVYNEHAHAGQGMDGRSPRAVYEATLPAKRTVTKDELRLCLWKSTKPLTVSKNGVTLFDRFYHFTGAGMFLGKQVFARYDPADLGRIWLFDAEDREIGPAECRWLLGKGATEADWRKVKALKKQERKIMEDAARIRARRRGEPDPWRHYLANKPDPPPDGEPKVLEPVRTKLRTVAKKVAAAQAADAAGVEYLPEATAGGGAGRPVKRYRSWEERLAVENPGLASLLRDKRDPFAPKPD